MSRTAEDIRRTPHGPRTLPPVGARRPAPVPSITDTALSNGFQVQAVHKPTAGMAHLRLYLPLAVSDPQELARAQMLARSLLAGTSRRDRVGIDIDLALIGGNLTAAAAPHAMGVAGSALSSGLDLVLDVIADALTDAAYPDEQVELDRHQFGQQLAMLRARPGVVAREALQRRRYDDHPAAHELPSLSDLQAVTAEELRDLHTTAVVPSGASLVVVSDLDPDQVADLTEQALAGWTSRHTARTIGPLPHAAGGDLLVVHRPDAVQSHLRLSAPGVPWTDPQYPALWLANLIFAGYFSSRLNENMRENKGLTYVAHSTLETLPGSSAIVVSVDTSTGTTAAALEELRAELARFVTSPPRRDERDRARRYGIGSLLITMASQNGLADQLAVLAVHGVGMGWLLGFLKDLDAVTTDELAAVVEEFFAPDSFTGVILGDSTVLATTLSDVAGVQMP